MAGFTKAQRREIERAERAAGLGGITGGVLGVDAKNRPVVSRLNECYAVQRNGKHAPITHPWRSTR